MYFSGGSEKWKLQSEKFKVKANSKHYYSAFCIHHSEFPSL